MLFFCVYGILVVFSISMVLRHVDIVILWGCHKLYFRYFWYFVCMMEGITVAYSFCSFFDSFMQSIIVFVANCSFCISRHLIFM